MTLRTITFDDSTHKLVPREPTEDQLLIMHERNYDMRNCAWFDKWLTIYKTGIEASPEYCDKSLYQEPDSQIAKQAERYEKVRKLNAHQFNELYWKNIHEGINFDFLVDELEKDE